MVLKSPCFSKAKTVACEQQNPENARPDAATRYDDATRNIRNLVRKD